MFISMLYWYQNALGLSQFSDMTMILVKAHILVQSTSYSVHLQNTGAESIMAPNPSATASCSITTDAN
jgi:hypothetical protein